MAEAPRILHLIAHDGNWEPFVRIAALAAALREQGFQSVVAAPDHSRLWELAEAAGVEVTEYTLENSINPLRWKELGELVKKTAANVVHVHDADAARLLSRSRFFTGTVGVVATRYTASPTPTSAEYGGNVDAVTCPSQALAKLYPSEEKVSVIYDGVNIAMAERAREEREVLRGHFRQQYCPSKEKPLFIINIAPFGSNGCQAEFLERMPDILSARPQTHLVLMGEGPQQAELERRIKVFALENDVSIVEPDKAFHRLLAAGDLYIALAKDDVSGLMVQAAMAAGRGVVARNSGCYGELIEDGKSGVVAEAEELQTAILDLLQTRTRREHFGRLAQARAQKLFAIADKAAAMAAIYHSVIAEKNK